jgi:spermidine/putrescine transport system substrate-binding protein
MDEERTTQKLTRLEVLQRGSVAAGALALGTAFPSAATASRRLFRKTGVVNFLAYPGHGDKFLLGPFEKATGIKVRIKEYTDGDQMLALAVSSPPGTFDVVMNDPELDEALLKVGLLEPLDPTDFPEATKNFWRQFKPASHFPVNWFNGKWYAVPWAFSYSALAYNTDHFTPAEVESLSVLWTPKAKGKVGMSAWWSNGMGNISQYDGNRKDPYNPTDAKFAHLRKTLRSLRPQVSGFYPIGDIVQGLGNGQIWLDPGGGKSTTIQLRKDGKPVSDVVPKEGGVQYTESLSIFAGARNHENAKKFIRYCISPAGCARKAILPAYQGTPVNKESWKFIAKYYPSWVDLLGIDLKGPNILDPWNEGHIAVRRLPHQQPVKEWQDAYTAFQSHH